MTREAEGVNRREFIRRAAKAGAAALAAGAVGLAAHDPHGPDPAAGAAPAERLRDFSVPAAGRKMAIARGAERAVTLDRALKAIGGIEAFIRPGDRVVIKVNAAFASPPSLGATTHPLVVSGLVRLCRGAGASAVIVTDNPINDPATCFALTGIGAAAREAGAEVVLPAESQFRPLSLPGGRLIRDWPVLAGPLDRATKLIGVAPVKDHHRSGASMTLKNWYGLLGGRRNIFHQDVHAIIAELALLAKPTLVVLDGTVTMMTNGPTGGSLADLKETGMLIAGTDPVAVDACGASLLGRAPDELPFLGQAAAAGAGTLDFRALNPVEVPA